MNSTDITISIEYRSNMIRAVLHSGVGSEAEPRIRSWKSTVVQEMRHLGVMSTSTQHQQYVALL